jgi:hypothetical protein
MKAGDQVMTPAGPGEVVTLRTRYVWTGLHTVARGFVAVHLDSDYGVRVFPAALVKPADEEESNAGV